MSIFFRNYELVLAVEAGMQVVSLLRADGAAIRGRQTTLRDLGLRDGEELTVVLTETQTMEVVSADASVSLCHVAARPTASGQDLHSRVCEKLLKADGSFGLVLASGRPLRARESLWIQDVHPGDRVVLQELVEPADFAGRYSECDACGFLRRTLFEDARADGMGGEEVMGLFCALCWQQ